MEDVHWTGLLVLLLREWTGMSRGQFARWLGNVPPSTVAAWEHGVSQPRKRWYPRFGTVAALHEQAAPETFREYLLRRERETSGAEHKAYFVGLLNLAGE